MASVNKVILIGNCGRDPEIRYLPSGQAVANISIATTSRRKDRTSGETVEDTQWHRVTFYDRLAEIAGEYVKKGRPIYIEGRLKYGKYTDQAGVEKNTVDIIATEMQLLGAREGMGAPSGGDEEGVHLRAAQQQPAQPPLAHQLANPPPSLPVVSTTWTTTFRFKPLLAAHKVLTACPIWNLKSCTSQQGSTDNKQHGLATQRQNCLGDGRKRRHWPRHCQGIGC